VRLFTLEWRIGEERARFDAVSTASSRSKPRICFARRRQCFAEWSSIGHRRAAFGQVAEQELPA